MYNGVIRAEGVIFINYVIMFLFFRGIFSSLKKILRSRSLYRAYPGQIPSLTQYSWAQEFAFQRHSSVIGTIGVAIVAL